MEREAMWVSLDERTFEYLRLQTADEAVMADGWIIHLDEYSYRIQYRLECDSEWRVRKVEMTRLGKDPEVLSLRSDGFGHWTDEKGKQVASVDGCIDIDIQASPFTNTLPIRRLALNRQESKTIDVVFITLPDLQVKSVSQRYTLESQDQTGTVYHFEGLDSGFSTDLPVDSDGLVIEYPEWFKRIWKR
ncbi:putative glycolipid-binding domain-containing protein [bacterium]|nr:putative glycolipid-binding domain-containing protein [bacterium]MCI0606675.1 putative glycolipid-binding domain-containing protein [bacterium]